MSKDFRYNQTNWNTTEIVNGNWFTVHIITIFDYRNCVWLAKYRTSHKDYSNSDVKLATPDTYSPLYNAVIIFSGPCCVSSYRIQACYVCLMNRNYLLLLVFHYYRHCSNTRSGVYRCDSRGVSGPIGGVKRKNFLGSLTLAITPPAQVS